MVEAMDEAIGRVLTALKEMGIDDNTVVFFMSDNGGLSTSEGHPTSNLPLRAGKGWLYEGGIREPMLIKWPGKAKAASVEETPVTSTDFYPTILEMANVPLRPAQHADGVSLAGLLASNTPLKRQAIFWHYPHYGNQGGTLGAAVRQGDYKLIEYFEDKAPELYNLKEDPTEKTNLASSHPEKLKELSQLIKQMQKDTDAKFPSANPNYKPKQ